MYAYDKSYASPFYPCLCCSFLASFRFLINTENDRIGVYISIVDAAFTLITIRPRLVSWCSSWTNRDYRIQSYQIVSHLDVNRDNRANRGKFFGCQKFCHDYHDWRDHRGHRIRSYDIVTNRNESYLILFLNRGYRD